MSDLTQDRLKELLHYCPDLGIFWWKERPGDTRFNTRMAGKIAGSNAKGYVSIGIAGKHYYGHRLVWLYMTGELPTDPIDHINCHPLDNAFGNLRLATRGQNGANRKANKNNTTGFKGVSMLPSGRFRASIQNGAKTEHIATFDSREEANAAYLKRAQELYGDFARAA